MTNITSLSDILKIAEDEYNKLTKEGGSFFICKVIQTYVVQPIPPKAGLKNFDQKFLKGNFEDDSIY